MRGRLASHLLGLAAALAAAGPSSLAFSDDASLSATRDADVRRRIAQGPPAGDPAAARAWATGVAAEGRARAGTVLGGDCLAAAASALGNAGSDVPGALRLWAECAAAYPTGAPEVGLAWYERGVLEARTGDALAGLVSLETAERIAAVAPPLEADADLRRRHEGLRTTMDGLGRAWRADLLERLGRPAEAADLHEAAALARGGGRAAGADGPWERGAIAAWRAGDRERARADVERALAATDDDRRVVQLEQWRLMAAHGRLDERGEPRLSAEPLDDAFLADAHAALDRVRGRDGRATFALRTAALVWRSGRRVEALAFYEAAFGDPGFPTGADLSALDRQRLVTGASVALEAGRPDLARAWCLRAELGAVGRVGGATGLRLRIEDALDRQGRDEGPAAPPLTNPGGADRMAPREGLLPPAGPAAEGDAAEPVGTTVAVPDGSGSVLALVLGAVAATLAAGAVVRRRRHPAPR